MRFEFKQRDRHPDGIGRDPGGYAIPNFTLTSIPYGAGPGSPIACTNGAFSYNLASGTYTVEIAGSIVGIGSGETTFISPLPVSNSAQSVTIYTPTALNQLPTVSNQWPTGAVINPSDGTATLVVQAVNSVGQPILQPYSVSVPEQTSPSLPAVTSQEITNNTTNVTSFSAVVPEIQPTTTSVVITPTNGEPITVNGLTFGSGSIVLLNAVI